MSAFAVNNNDDASSFSFASSNDCPYDDLSIPDPDDGDLNLELDELDETLSDIDMESVSLSKQLDTTQYSQYILGTLVVRVVAARNLQPVEHGGLGKMLFGNLRRSSSKNTRNSHRIIDHSSANPFVKLIFGDQTQRTTEVYQTTDPVWPRGEQSYFDVSLPVPILAHEDSKSDGVVTKPPKYATESQLATQTLAPRPDQPLLTVVIFHTNGTNGKSHRQKGKQLALKTQNHETDEDTFLGLATVDLTQLLTGKVSSFDEWLSLGGGDDTTGEVRIICEYEPTDPPPRAGDTCRFTGFVNSIDLYPIPPSHVFRVEDVERDAVILSYSTPEGWYSTFKVHRFMLICAARHQTAVEKYYDELTEIADKLYRSPAAGTINAVVGRLPEDGLIFIGAEAAKGGAALVSRWFQGGLGTAVGDIIYATNWDGQHSPAVDENNTRSDSSDDEDSNDLSKLGGLDDFDSREATPGMPCCPITGQPMRNPVVAADGHTYERKAIARWLRNSDISPLTGSILPHKELVPNYLLLSNFQNKETIGLGIISNL